MQFNFIMFYQHMTRYYDENNFESMILISINNIEVYSFRRIRYNIFRYSLDV